MLSRSQNNETRCVCFEYNVFQLLYVFQLQHASITTCVFQ